ncbi:hypothetical protein [Pyrococcus kukulkanii]
MMRLALITTLLFLLITYPVTALPSLDDFVSSGGLVVRDSKAFPQGLLGSITADTIISAMNETIWGKEVVILTALDPVDFAMAHIVKEFAYGDRAGIIITPYGVYDKEIAGVIIRAKPAKVVILGIEGAVNDLYYKALTKAGIPVEVVTGRDAESFQKKVLDYTFYMTKSVTGNVYIIPYSDMYSAYIPILTDKKSVILFCRSGKDSVALKYLDRIDIINLYVGPECIDDVSKVTKTPIRPYSPETFVKLGVLLVVTKIEAELRAHALGKRDAKVLNLMVHFENAKTLLVNGKPVDAVVELEKGLSGVYTFKTSRTSLGLPGWKELIIPIVLVVLLVVAFTFRRREEF